MRAIACCIVGALTSSIALADITVDLRDPSTYTKRSGGFYDLASPVGGSCIEGMSESGGIAGRERYLVSRFSGATWEYWNGTDWASGAGAEQAMSAEALGAVLEWFYDVRFLVRIYGLDGDADPPIDVITFKSCVCGDGVRTSNEQCDDGNADDGDGCSSACQAERGMTCVDEGCFPVCANGVVNRGEECDDGNLYSGDGCDEQCRVEPSWACYGSASLCAQTCGNGVLDAGEQCDDGNGVYGDGCDSECRTHAPNHCGDGVLDQYEACDDGNRRANDGCYRCIVEPGYTCDGGRCVATCGNGVRQGVERCDDKNRRDGDGCSATCGIEPGFVCSGSLSRCSATCGNGLPDFGEYCDDGNERDRDGCSSNCQIEPGYTCVGLPSECDAICGDGFVGRGEACDDGNEDEDDGCTSLCRQQAGFVCVGAPSVCIESCGNGVLDAFESCDDANLANGDGCSRNCYIESAYRCGGIPSVCWSICGDGLARSAETCDGGDLVDGDGCDTMCQREYGWSCDAQGCTAACGDGFLVGGETCDDGNTNNGDGCSATCSIESPSDDPTVPDDPEDPVDPEDPTDPVDPGEPVPGAELADDHHILRKASTLYLKNPSSYEADRIHLAGTPGGGALGCRGTSSGPLASLLALALVGRRRRRGILLFVMAASLPEAARAQEVQGYTPAATLSGLATVKGADTMRPREAVLTLGTVYARNPLVLQTDAALVPIVRDRVDVVLSYAVGMTSRLDLAAIVPYVPWQRGEARWDGVGFRAGTSRSAGLADPRVEARVLLLDEQRDGVGMAVVPALTLPLASGAFRGEPSLLFSPEIALSRHVGKALLAANVGARLGQSAGVGTSTTNGSSLVFRAGLGWSLDWLAPRATQASFELFGSTQMTAPFVEARYSPLEALLNVRQRVGDVVVSAGGGMGLIAGLGAPLFRTMLSVAWSPSAPVPERVLDATVLVTKDSKPPMALAAARDPAPLQVPEATPRPDRDDDGLLDHEDACPEDPETINEVDDTDGCPDKGESFVAIENDEIVMEETVFFGVGKLELRPRAKRVLNQVAALLTNHREIARVSIEGHTDDTGGPQRNLALSRTRAEVVRTYLLRRGVAPERLSVVGHGSSVPRVHDDTPTAKARNRRVQFRILADPGRSGTLVGVR